MVSNLGTSKVWNVEILVESDVESQKGIILGALDPKRSTITVSIDAVNPESIKAGILGYQT